MKVMNNCSKLVRRSSSSRSNFFSTSTVSHFQSAALPSHANVVIVGGGIIGTSIAYHLGKLGVDNTILLEQNQLTAGTTWHAAGLMVTFGSLSETSTEIRKYTKQLYSEIEKVSKIICFVHSFGL